MWSKREFRFRRFGERLFERGDLKFLILELLKEKPRHGYEVIRALEERFGGFYAPSAGAVYPTLQMLEDMEYVTGIQQDGKKVYTITEEGQKFLAQRQPMVDEIWERMRGHWNPELGHEMYRMMHELRDFGRTFAHEARRRWPDADRTRRIREVVLKAKQDIDAILAEEHAPAGSTQV